MPETWQGRKIAYWTTVEMDGSAVTGAELSEKISFAAANGLSVSVTGDVTDDVVLVPGAEVTVKGTVGGQVSVKVPAQGGGETYDITAYVKGIGTVGENGVVTLKPVLDAEKVAADSSLSEMAQGEAMASLMAAGPSQPVTMTLKDVKPGLYYGLGAASSLTGLDAATASAPKAQATADGVTLTVTKPEGDSGFFRLVVDDKE